MRPFLVLGMVLGASYGVLNLAVNSGIERLSMAAAPFAWLQIPLAFGTVFSVLYGFSHRLKLSLALAGAAAVGIFVVSSGVLFQ